jgi:muramoyltetrapeptide carboxypeptidase
MSKSRKRRIHITAVGSSAGRDVDRLSPDAGFKGMLELARAGVAGRYEVTGNRRLIYAEHGEKTGGRMDDAERARELTKVLADDSVAALVTIRGGAWFTRILELVDFDVLSRRRTSIHLFGFSEMTTFINIAAQYDTAVAVYDLGPGFLLAANERWAYRNIQTLTRTFQLGPKRRFAFALGWGMARYPIAFTDFFRDVADIVDGRGSARLPVGRVLRGRIPQRSQITVMGGTLSVILPLLGSRYAPAVDTRGKWIALEDINEDVDPIDRMMAGLKLAGLFERAEGVILGNFHKGAQELSEKAYHILLHHLPRRRELPVIALDTFGHIENIAPLPIGRPLTLRRLPGRGREPRVQLDVPWADWVRSGSRTSGG